MDVGEIAPTALAWGSLLVVVLAAYLLRRIGVLPMSPTETAAVARADRAEHELAEANKRIGELEQHRSLKPVLELLHQSATAQSQVIDKLASFNGSMDAIRSGLAETQKGLEETRQGLHEVVEAVRFVAGLAVSDGDVPVRRPTL